MIVVATAFSGIAYKVGKQNGVNEVQKQAVRVGAGRIVSDDYGKERFTWRAR